MSAITRTRAFAAAGLLAASALLGTALAVPAMQQDSTSAMTHDGTPAPWDTATLATFQEGVPAPWDTATLATFQESAPGMTHDAVPGMTQE